MQRNLHKNNHVKKLNCLKFGLQALKVCFLTINMLFPFLCFYHELKFCQVIFGSERHIFLPKKLKFMAKYTKAMPFYEVNIKSLS